MDKSNGLVYQLKDSRAIGREQVAYNITWGKGKAADFSYIQLGDVNEKVNDVLTWLPSPSSQYFFSDVFSANLMYTALGNTFVRPIY